MYPPAAAPPTPTDPKELTLSADDLSAWWRRVELARSRRKRESAKWRSLLMGYLPPDPNAASSDINSNVHFRDVHLKIASMYAQFPELQLTPLEPIQGLLDPQTGQPFVGADGQPMDPRALAAHVVSVKRAVLNKLLGADYADVDTTILECLFDIFAVSGVAFTKICFEADIQPTPMEVPGEPTMMPGAILGLQDVPGVPGQKMVPVTVNQRIRWYRFSPNAGLLPHDYHSTKYDLAPYLMMEFEEPLNARTRAMYHLPERFSSFQARGELIVSDGHKDPSEGASDIVKGIEIWLRACLFDPDVADFDRYHRLVLVEGMKDAAAIYEPSPYQTVGPDGKLTVDSLIGNAIHPITLRVATDMAWIPSDAAFTDPIVRNENEWLSDTVKLRKSNIARFFHADSIADSVDKLKNADVGQGVGIPDEKMALGMERLIFPLPHLENAMSDVQGAAVLKRYREETLGTGSNQAGAVNQGQRSATETAIVQQNVSVRLKGEHNRLLQAILRGVRKFDTLAMRYLDQDYIHLAGPEGAQMLALFDRQMISGRYAYDAHPDTMVSIDADVLQEKWLKFTNFMAKSAYLNQEENARNGALAFGYDPSHLIVTPPPPPEPPPEKARVSLALSAADLGMPEVRQILAETGVRLQPEPSSQAVAAHLADQAANLPHGGPADRADVLSEHISEHTGAQDGRPPVMPGTAPPAVPGIGLH